MTRSAVLPLSAQRQTGAAISAIRALYGPSLAELQAALPAVLDTVAQAVAVAQRTPTRPATANLRRVLVAAERELARIAAAQERGA